MSSNTVDAALSIVSSLNLIPSGNSYSYTYRFPDLSLSAPTGKPYVTIQGGGGYISSSAGGSINANFSTVYYSTEKEQYFVDYDIFVPLIPLFVSAGHPEPFHPLPAGADSFYISLKGFNLVMNGSSKTSSVGGTVSSQPIIDSACFYYNNVDYPLIIGSSSFYSTFVQSNVMNFASGNAFFHLRGSLNISASNSSQVSGTVMLTNTFTISLNNFTVHWLKGGTTASSLDLQDQTDQINQQIQDQTQQQTDQVTNGFDNSSGQSDADRLAGEMNDYFTKEDELYDQMQYEVPVIDLQSDAQGILLGSNFLQSLYVSDPFISKCITFVLSFGLIMYIVGWLKKKDG